jgi:hypothetical protein
MNNQAIYGMMQKLLKKFKDTSVLLVSAASDYSQPASEVGRSYIVNPVGSPGRVFRVAAEANIPPGTVVATISNAHASQYLHVYTYDYSQLLCVIKPAGKATIGFVSPGSYTVFDKSQLDTAGYNHRQTLSGSALVDVASASTRTKSAQCSEHVYVRLQYTSGANGTFMVHKWDVTNQVWRSSTGLTIAAGATHVNHTYEFELIPLTATKIAIPLWWTSWYAPSYYVQYTTKFMRTVNIVVGADGVNPTCTLDNSTQFSSHGYDSTVDAVNWNTTSGNKPHVENTFSAVKLSSTAIAVSYRTYADAGIQAGPSRITKFTFSGDVPTESTTTTVVASTVAGVKMPIASIDADRVLLTLKHDIDAKQYVVQINVTTGTLGSFVDLSTYTAGSNAIVLGLSSSKGVVAYQDGASSYKQRVITYAAGTGNPTLETASTLPTDAHTAVPTHLFRESDTAYSMVGYKSDLSMALGTVGGITLSVWDVTGGNTCAIRTQYKTNGVNYCYPNGRQVFFFPSNATPDPKEYVFIGSSDNTKNLTANQCVLQKMYATGSVINGTVELYNMGGYTQAV